MKIKYVTGCTAESLTINNKETIDYELNDLKEKVHEIVDSIDDISYLQDIIIRIVESQGDYTNLGRCETCGDHVYEYTLNI